MRLRWTGKAVSDLQRLHDFLAPANPRVAAEIVQALARAPARLLERPRMGTRLEAFGDREVRRIFVRDYEMRYEIAGDAIYILRLWHGREDR